MVKFDRGFLIVLPGTVVFLLIAVYRKWCKLIGDGIGISLTDRVCFENGRVIYFRDLEKLMHCIPTYL